MLGGKIDVGWLALFLLGWLTYFLQRVLLFFCKFFVQFLVTLFCLILPTNHSFGNRVFGQFFVKKIGPFLSRDLVGNGALVPAPAVLLAEYRVRV